MFASFERFVDLGTEQESMDYYEIRQETNQQSSGPENQSNAIRQYYDDDVLQTNQEEAESVIIHHNVQESSNIIGLTDTQILREQLLTRQSDDNLYVVTTESNEFLYEQQPKGGDINLHKSLHTKMSSKRQSSRDSALLKAYQDNQIQQQSSGKQSVGRLSSGRVSSGNHRRSQIRSNNTRIVNLNEVSFEYQGTPNIIEGGDLSPLSSSQAAVSRHQKNPNSNGTAAGLSMTRREDLRIDCYDEADSVKTTSKLKKSRSRSKKVPAPQQSDFLEYSIEWQKLKHAKIMQKKLEQEQQMIEDARPVHKPVDPNQLPNNYKGPLSGYYARVNEFFEKKKLYEEVSLRKVGGTPQINQYPQAQEYLKRSRSKDRPHNNNTLHKIQIFQQRAIITDSTSKEENELTGEIGEVLTQSLKDEIDFLPIEERLIQKGIQYKNQLVQKRHDMISSQIELAPTFKPQMISNNDAYLKKRMIEDTSTLLENINLQELSQATISNLNRTLLQPGQQQYYEAMVFLMNKQNKIIEHQMLESLKLGKPKIKERSRLIALQDKTRVRIFERPTSKEGLFGTLNPPPQKQNSQPQVNAEASRERIKEFLARNYQRHLNKLNQEKANKELEQQQTECEFKPQLSEGTQNYINQIRLQQAETGKKTLTFEELYAQAKKIQKRKDDQRKIREQELQSKEMAEVTFKPTINYLKPKKQVKEYIPKKPIAGGSYLKQHFKTQYATKNNPQQPVPQQNTYLSQYQQKKEETLFTCQSPKFDQDSNLLDFNEENFMAEADKALIKVFGKDYKTNSNKKRARSPLDNERNSQIEGFLSEMLHNSSQNQMSKVIEEARKALLDCDESEEGAEESDEPAIVTIITNQAKFDESQQLRLNLLPTNTTTSNGHTQLTVSQLQDITSTRAEQSQIPLQLNMKPLVSAILEEDQNNQIEEEVKDMVKTEQILVMNRTLSLIEEDEEEVMTNEDQQSRCLLFGGSVGAGSLGNSQKIYIEDSLRDEINQELEYGTNICAVPGIVRDIEQMERDFTSFLEQIYN